LNGTGGIPTAAGIIEARSAAVTGFEFDAVPFVTRGRSS